MSVDKSFLVQKQVKDNSEDLQKEFLNLQNWEEEMKRKEKELLNKNNDKVLPPIRSKKKKVMQKPPVKEKCKSNTKRIKSGDYSSWDKFDVEKACKEIDKTDSSDESGEELNEDELKKLHNIATEHKQKGNILVQQQKWDSAIACYSEAIKVFPYDAVFYANRALCHLKKDNLYSAEADCSTAIQLDSQYVKAYHRRALSRIELKQYKEAKEDLEKILQLEPSNKEAQAKLAQVNKKLETKSIVISEEKTSKKETSIEKTIGEKICNSNKKIDKEISNKKTEQDVVNKTIKNKTKYMQIPDWLPEKDNVEIVEPIIKPPHLRSKKPMKRIVVQDAEFEIATSKKEATLIESDKIPKAESFNNMIDDKVVAKNKVLIKSCEIEKDIPVDLKIPKTAVQFIIDWRRNKSSKYRYRYLKQLPPNNLPQLFQNSMESDIFSEILDILRIEFIPRKDSIYEYLECLSQVKRFRALVMFINNIEKEGIKTLIEYSKDTANISEEKIKKLYEVYEI